MAGIRANITIDLPDGVDFAEHVQQLQRQLSKISGLKTSISIRDIDNPISLNTRIAKKVNKD